MNKAEQVKNLKQLAKRIEADLMQFEFDSEKLGIPQKIENLEKFDRVIEILKKAEHLDENE